MSFIENLKIEAVLRTKWNSFHLAAGKLYILGNDVEKKDSCVLLLKDESVDPKHAAIDFRTGKLIIMDIFSKYGTFLNSEKLTTMHQYIIEKSCALQFGNVLAELEIIVEQNDANDASVEIVLSTPERSKCVKKSFSSLNPFPALNKRSRFFHNGLALDNDEEVTIEEAEHFECSSLDTDIEFPECLSSITEFVAKQPNTLDRRSSTPEIFGYNLPSIQSVCEQWNHEHNISSSEEIKTSNVVSKQSTSKSVENATSIKEKCKDQDTVNQLSDDSSISNRGTTTITTASYIEKHDALVFDDLRNNKVIEKLSTIVDEGEYVKRNLIRKNEILQLEMKSERQTRSKSIKKNDALKQNVLKRKISKEILLSEAEKFPIKMTRQQTKNAIRNETAIDNNKKNKNILKKPIKEKNVSPRSTFRPNDEDNRTTTSNSIKAKLRKSSFNPTIPDGSNKKRIYFNRINNRAFNFDGLDIEIVSDPLKADLVIAESLEHSYVFLIAIVRGIPIVSQKWLKAVISEKKISVPYESYLVCDKLFEKKYKFKLEKSLKLAKRSKIFKGYTFLMTTNLKLHPTKMQDIIICGGGKVITESTPTTDTSKLVLITENADKKQWAKYEKKYFNINNIDSGGIFSSVIQQSIQFSNHRLI